MLNFNIIHISSVMLFMLGTITSTAYANICDQPNTIDNILKEAGLGSTEGALLDCKVLPQQTQRAVIAAALPIASTVEADYAEYALSLVTINANTGDMIQTYTDPKVLVSDAIMLNSLKLDTAAYLLNAKQRALGVRLNYVGSSRVNPYNPQTLNLYHLTTRQKILDSFVVSLDRGEWDGNCDGEWGDHRSTLQMLKTSNKGYADIKVTTQDETYQTQTVKRECKDVNKKTQKRSFVLKFDGQQYQIPKQYRSEFQY